MTAKNTLTLSEFNAYDAKKKAHKMEEMGEMLAEHEMPLE
jgi:hypothetical protein